MSHAVLTTRRLSVRYGRVIAVDDVSIEIDRSSITGLIGPNGAGKTSFIDAICGMCRSSGEVLLDGTALGQLTPHRRVSRGLSRTFQSLELFEDLTVGENLAVAGASGRARVEQLLSSVGLAASTAGRSPRHLPHGQRRLVAVARALASKPTVIVLDEPAAGLDDGETAALGLALRSIAEHGTTVLMVEHDMDLVMSICDAIFVLSQGRLIASGRPADVMRNPAVIASYLGADAVASRFDQRHDHAGPSTGGSADDAR
jgi:branched-chain amino acid transport system ATP-binding protein